MAKLNKKSRAIAKALRARRAMMEAQFAKTRAASDYSHTMVGQRQHATITSAYTGSTAARAIVRDGTAPTGRFERPKKKV